MKNLIKTPHEFATNKKFVGSYIGIDDETKMFVFEDGNGVPSLIPITPHTQKAVDQIMIGDFVEINAANDAFDIGLMDAKEIKEYKDSLVK